jgi:hypothetical protein
VLSGIFVLLVLYLMALYLGLEMLRNLLSTLAPYSAFAVIVMFQSEIRRALARLGRHSWSPWGSRLQRREFIEEILLALDYLSSKKIGALIVLEREHSHARAFCSEKPSAPRRRAVLPVPRCCPASILIRSACSDCRERRAGGSTITTSTSCSN